MANKYAGTKTEKNLWEAFAGESQARNKYTYFASVAKKAGYEQIAALFLKTADNEKEHAKLWFKELNELGTTEENLLRNMLISHTVRINHNGSKNSKSHHQYQQLKEKILMKLQILSCIFSAQKCIHYPSGKIRYRKLHHIVENCSEHSRYIKRMAALGILPHPRKLRLRIFFFFPVFHTILL